MMMDVEKESGRDRQMQLQSPLWPNFFSFFLFGLPLVLGIRSLFCLIVVRPFDTSHVILRPLGVCMYRLLEARSASF